MAACEFLWIIRWPWRFGMRRFLKRQTAHLCISIKLFQIIEDSNFPHNPQEAIIEGFARAEQEFMDKNEVQNGNEMSGSCALVCLVIDNAVYIANVGDSRAVLSKHKGREAAAITMDHKPNMVGEKRRILANGGNVYK